MTAIRKIALQIIDILEFFEREGYAVVIPHKYFSDRSHSLQMLGMELSKIDQQLTNDLFVGIITKAPAEARRHARHMLAEFLT